MKKVTLTFIGYESEEVAKRFYSWMVGGGLSEGLLDNLSDQEIDVCGVVDSNNESLEIAITSTPKKTSV